MMLFSICWDVKNLPKKFRDVILWTTYGLFLLFIIILVIIPLIATLFFPNADIARYEAVLDKTVSVIGLISLILAIFSVYQSSDGSKRMEKILTKMEEIRNSQDSISSQVSQMSAHFDVGVKNPDPQDWRNHDPTGHSPN